LPSLSLSKCWKILCSSHCRLLELALDDPLPEHDNDPVTRGLTTSDCLQNMGRPNLKLRFRGRRFAIASSLAAYRLVCT
jgi:hypothetical protein